MKGKETIDNAQTIRYNHGQTSDQAKGSKGQGTIGRGFFDLVRCLVKEAGTDCRRGCGLRRRHQRSTFGKRRSRIAGHDGEATKMRTMMQYQ
jgi:hypothetical protein